ncbi:MAG: hypothetical protein ACLFN8_00065 [Candidatus Woesearchaeota archaeon]
MKNNKISQKKDKKIYALILLVITLLLLFPVILKTGFNEKVFTSQETYHNLIILKEIQQEPLPKQMMTQNPFHIILQKLNADDVLIVLLIPLLAGIISIILIYFILNKLNLSDNETILAIILLTLTPIFLNKFTTLNPDNLAFPLMLSALLLHLNKSHFTIIPLLLLIVTNPALAISILIVLTINFITTKKTNSAINKNKTNYTTSLLITIIISLIAIIAYFLIHKMPIIKINNLHLDNLLIEFGSLTGYSIPLIILGIIGLFTWWDNKKQKTMMIILTTGFVLSIIIPELRLIIAFALSIFAGIGINQLMLKEWNLKQIKQITLMLMFYIILFSAIIIINTQISQISKQEVQAAQFLKDTDNNGIILSTEDKGYMIEYHSNKKTLLNKNSYLDLNYEEVQKDTREIFYSRSLGTLEELLKKHKITYIYIHENMKNGQIWSAREEGLLFFLIHSDKFIKLFDNEKVQIYKYTNIRDDNN